MGMPNPLKKVYYTMEEERQPSQAMLPTGENIIIPQSTHGADMSQYATKDDMERMKEELKAVIASMKETKQNGKSSV